MGNISRAMSINTRNLILYSERNGNNSTESSFISARVFQPVFSVLEPQYIYVDFVNIHVKLLN